MFDRGKSYGRPSGGGHCRSHINTGGPGLKIGRDLVEKIKGNVKVSQLLKKIDRPNGVTCPLDVQKDKHEILARLKYGIGYCDQIP